MIGPIALGIRGRKMIRRLEAPSDLAASVNSFSFSDRKSPRTMRASVIQKNRVSTMMMSHGVGTVPRRASDAMTRVTRRGIARNRSVTLMSRLSGIADPRVERSVQDVRHEVEGDDERDRDHDPRQHDRVVAELDRPDEQAPPPRPREDRPRDGETAGDRSDIDGDLRRERDQRVAHPVSDDDPALAAALGTRP